MSTSPICWKKRLTRRWVTVAWDVWQPASSTPWRRWGSRRPVTVSTTSMACSASHLTMASRWKPLTTGGAAATRGSVITKRWMSGRYRRKVSKTANGSRRSSLPAKPGPAGAWLSQQRRPAAASVAGQTRSSVQPDQIQRWRFPAPSSRASTRKTDQGAVPERQPSGR
ncbi:hypothetical protein BANRA_00051 [Klebsiella pneumoniae]|nr:hypothetical protein BANRA_00051 [Klebsiella pneumoniae]